MGGLVTMGALPGAASAGIVQVALKDDEALAPGERTARRIGRRASVAGAAATTAGGIAAVSVAGTTAGLSAAGSASGLAAIGGGMAAGPGIVIAAPAVAAAGIGFGSYRLGRHISARRNRRDDGADGITTNETSDEQVDDSESAPTHEEPEVYVWLELLVNGPSQPLSDLPTGTGDSAGVFTIWYRDELVHYGRATDTSETKPSNYRQADGVRGRVKGLTRQPSPKMQKRLEMHFADDWSAIAESTNRKRATDLLKSQGRCRIVRFSTGGDASSARERLAPHLEPLLLGVD